MNDALECNRILYDWCLFQLLDNIEMKMKGTCVEGAIPKLFEGKMLVCNLYINWVLVGHQ